MKRRNFLFAIPILGSLVSKCFGDLTPSRFPTIRMFGGYIDNLDELLAMGNKTDQVDNCEYVVQCWLPREFARRDLHNYYRLVWGEVFLHIKISDNIPFVAFIVPNDNSIMEFDSNQSAGRTVVLNDFIQIRNK